MEFLKIGIIFTERVSFDLPGPSHIALPIVQILAVCLLLSYVITLHPSSTFQTLKL